MNMRLFVFSILMIFVSASSPASELDSLSVTDSLRYFDNEGLEQRGIYTHKSVSSEYDLRIRKYRKHWEGLIPTQVIIQNAGNMGLLSVGIGWDYGKHSQWETNLLFGYLPAYKSSRWKTTMTIKQNFIPWSVYLKEGWLMEPLSCGLYMNTVFGEEFWGRQPSRYPNKYYEYLSTKVRFNIFAGQRITKIIPHNKRKAIKGITAFYEISTCDLYLRTMIIDDYLSLWDILGLSLGIKIQLL